MPRIYPRPPRGEAPPEFGIDANAVQMRTINLTAARVAPERVELAGSVLWAVTGSVQTALVNVALNDQQRAPIPFQPGTFIRGIRFSRVYISNAAQPGDTITLLYAAEGPDNIQIENPSAQFGAVSLVPATIAALIAGLNPVELAAATIAALNPVELAAATIAALNPVDLAAATVAALNPVTSQPQNLGNGWASAGIIAGPPANTIFADTGPLPAGIYDFKVYLGCGLDVAWRETALEHRNAADVGNIQIFQEHWCFNVSDHRYFTADGYSLALNERIRLRMGVAAGLQNWCGAITWVRRE